MDAQYTAHSVHEKDPRIGLEFFNFDGIYRKLLYPYSFITIYKNEPKIFVDVVVKNLGWT